MCDGCQRLTKENAGLTEEISGLLYTTRKQAASIAGLERELRKLRIEDPGSKEVWFVLTEWRRLTGHLRADIEPDGDRWGMVARGIKRWTLERCLFSVQGVALAPHMHFGHYRLTPCGKPDCCKRKDDIKDFFKDSGRFEELVDIGRRAEQAPSERLFEALERVAVQDKLLAQKVLQALAREAADRLLAEADPEVRAGRTPVDAVVFDLRKRRVA